MCLVVLLEEACRRRDEIDQQQHSATGRGHSLGPTPLSVLTGGMPHFSTLAVELIAILPEVETS